MSERLTPADLDALEALEAKATAAPWSVHSSDVWSGDGETPLQPLYRAIRESGSRAPRLSEYQEDDNSAFIAALRNAAPALIAAARRAEQLREALQEIARPGMDVSGKDWAQRELSRRMKLASAALEGK